MTKLIQSTDPLKVRDDLEKCLQTLEVTEYDANTVLTQYDQALKLHIPLFTSSVMQDAGRHTVNIEFNFRKLPEITITIDAFFA